MGYFLGFALLIAGYTLVDWGHYRVAHRNASMWWLVSGKGTPPTDAAPGSGSPSSPSNPANPFTNPFIPKLAPKPKQSSASATNLGLLV